MRDAFVGRRTELDELTAAVDAAASGRGSVVLLAGEPGIGKTRLTQAVSDHAAASGLSVHGATCWEGPASSFWPWTQIVRSVIAADGDGDAPSDVRRLAEGAPPEAATTEGDAGTIRFALFDGLARFLRTSSTRRPLLLTLDDLHWADAGSLRMLEFLTSDLKSDRIAVVGTFRDAELVEGTDIAGALRRLVAKTEVIELAGLGPTEVAELLTATSGALADTSFARQVYQRTAGNPLFVRELGRLLLSHRSGERVPALSVPPRVHDVIARRLARLSQQTSALLGVAAVFGREFRMDLLARTAGADLPAAMARIEEAASARIVDAVDHAVGLYCFSHALVWEVLYEGLPLTRRAELHRSAAETLEATGDPESLLPEIAHHYLNAAAIGFADKAAGYSMRAGRRALDSLAFEDAVAHFERALGALALAPDDECRSDLLRELGTAQLRAGDIDAARTTFEDAVELARRRGRPGDLATAALGFAAGLEGFEVRLVDRRQIELLREALAALGDDEPALRAWLLARLSVALSYEESTEQRRAYAEEAIEIARRCGDRAALAHALAAHCDAIAGPFECERRIEEASEIVAISVRDADAPMELLGRRLLVKAYLEAGDHPSAFAQMDAFERAAEPLRQPLYSWYVPLWKGLRAQIEGRLREALAFADEAESIGSRVSSVNAPMLAAVLRLTTLYHWERYDEMPPHLAVVESMMPFIEDYMDYYRGTMHALRGDISAAAPHVSRFARRGMSNISVDAEWLPGVANFAQAMWLVGNTEMAADLYELMLPHRSRFAVEGIGAGIYGSVEHHLGLLAQTRGDPSAAEAHLLAALEANRRIEAPLIVARTLEALAGLLDGRGAPGDAERAAALRAECAALRAPPAEPADELARDEGAVAAFRLVGEMWTLSFAGRTVHLKDAKGLQDLAKLLSSPGREIAALDLVTASGPRTSRPGTEHLRAAGDTGEVVDEQARSRYKTRLVELEEDIADAEELGDTGRAERARAERDAIAHELAAAYGLGGRPRRTGDPAERARTTVTRRIREAMGRIEEAHRPLGRHLRASVHTGTFCVYRPERDMRWQT